MRLYFRIYRIGVFAILLFFGIFLLVSPEKRFSQNENRYLEAFPEITADSVFNGEFQEKFEHAVSDQFPCRDFWMMSSTVLKRLEGYREISGVYLGRDDYCLAKVAQRDIDQNHYMQNLRYIEYLGKKHGGKTSFVLVPSAGDILSDKLPPAASFYSGNDMFHAADIVLGKTKYIDVRPEIAEYAKQTQVYFRTDHHWTLSGAYAAYSAYCEANKFDMHTYGYFSVKKVSESFLGTHHSKVMLPGMEADTVYAATNIPQADVVCDGEEKTSIYDVEKLTEKNKYDYFFGGNYAEVVLTMKKNPKRKLLVIKDSFANSFVPFLMGDYDEIKMIDLRYYQDSVQKLLKENYAQILILYELSNFAKDKNIYKVVF